MAWISSVNVTPSPPSPFYTNGTFWAGAAAIVGLVSLVVLGWLTWRAANPKRRLWYSMPTVTPLATTGTGIQSGDLKISYSDRPLKSPATANIQLVSRGRLDIPRSAFDDNQPLQLDVGAPIVKVLNVATSPNCAKPPLETDGSRLLVQPCLIGRRETIVITLLVEGVPYLRPLLHTLENVDIRRADPGQPRSARSITIAVLGGAAVGVLTVLTIAANVAPGAAAKWFPAIEQKPLWWAAGASAAVTAAMTLLVTVGEWLDQVAQRSYWRSVLAGDTFVNDATAEASADAAVADAEGRTAAAEQRAHEAIEQARAEAATRVGAAEADRDQAREDAERYRQDAQRADQRGAAADACAEDARAETARAREDTPTWRAT
jgi:hypothetical protein